MINIIPNNWKYNDSLEMLWLFYQSTDELLSEISPDTYSLPLHNALTLVDEMDEVYSLLNQYNIVKDYYKNYISPIIDEFIVATEEDNILKNMLGKRLKSIKTGFEEARDNPSLFDRWVGVFRQSCNPVQYRNLYKSKIEELVINNNQSKTLLLYCIKNFYICLIHIGYSREYLYTSAKKYFNNRNNFIDKPDSITKFLNLFDGKRKKYEFLVLMNTESIDYIQSISDNIRINMKVEKISHSADRKDLCVNCRVRDLFAEYDKKVHEAREHDKFAIVKYEAYNIDPYAAAEDLISSVQFSQCFSVYFKHFYAGKQVYRFLLKKDDESYCDFNLPNKLNKRPYVKKELIDSRIVNIISRQAMSPSAFFSLAQAIDMHAEALESKSYLTLVRTFWTALETLFSDPNANSSRENVNNSVKAIIQKTYLLKISRLVYMQICESVSKVDLEKIGITSYCSFLEYFSAYSADSPEMKQLYKLFENNILLRIRIYSLRKKLNTGVDIEKYLEKHEEKINWQLKRLYRIRNIATHLGQETMGLKIAVNHLHNYFDYAVNYMICKSENQDIVVDISTLVFETKNDNQIHKEILKSSQALSKTTYMKYFFGPDQRLINYKFEY